ncbi:MAG: DUF262 domain-containing protein [Bacteroidetes bacterium]|nr:DUF262 domain-containing protein [Bacteroidota bacterium]
MPTINIILANVESGGLILPDFQRGYVWRRWQVRDLFDSLYRGHPVGSLLTWLTTRDGIKTELLLDGQQRVTSLYGVIRGHAPKFFSGDAHAFKNLYFHAVDERFEFYQPIKMKGESRWFDVTKVMRAGAGGIIDIIKDRFATNEQTLDPELSLQIMQALNRLVGLGTKNFHIEQIADDNKKIGEVVDIFNRLNSAGTRLSKGDLALAKVAVKWPDVRNEMRKVIQEWNKHDFDFTLDWLLRCVNAVIYGEAAFRHLHNISRNTFENGLLRTVKHVDTVLNQILSKLKLDDDRVLFAKFAIPVLVRHLELCGRRKIDAVEWNLLLYWFLRAGIQGRFSGSTETRIRESLVAVDGTLTGVERLIAEIGTTWGRPRILAADFDSSTIGARAYPVLYWLTRVGRARNFCNGIQLQAHLIGPGSKLQVHHIFPKAGLYKAGYERAQVNALGNFCFLTASCNQWIGAALPAEPSESVRGNQGEDLYRIDSEGYFYWVREKYPGILESQWIPMDEELWKVENYPHFLNARRKLLAIAANEYLGDLNPRHAETEDVTKSPDQVVEPVKSPSHIASPDEESELRDIQEWMKSCRLPQGEFGYQLEENGIIIDLAWQNGLPEGIGRPVALLLNESAETYRTVSQAGYDCFTDVRSFKKYVDTEIAGE